MEKSNVKNKTKIFKTIFFLTLLILSYIISVYVKGFSQTNSRIIHLIVFAIIGFCSFYIVYYIIYIFTKLKYKKQEKANNDIVVNCDDKVNEFLKDEKYKFLYNTKLSVKDNIDNALSVAKSVILDVATLNNKNNKYFYL
ncbi:MAG: hypothetical protein IJW26_05075, partial [Clostridia bacterium]|nr:hypothetical protein [Clostridia bacterium]